MKITYDLEYIPERKGGGKESEEVLAIKAFLAGTSKNMCFEYETAAEAKRKHETIRNFRCNHKLKEVFDLLRRDNCLYVVKIKKTPAKKA